MQNSPANKNVKSALINYSNFLRPRLIAFSGVFILALLGWVYLGAMSGHSMSSNDMTLSGTGMSAFNSIIFLGSMWVAMAIAMMLPTAVPMISAYVEICETAKAKSIATVSPFILIAGYVSVWLVFAISAAIIQVNILSLVMQYPALESMQQPSAAIVIIAAGIYQFTHLKQACLTKCRAPLNFFFANWSDRTSVIYRLGVKQGLFCLGCCWALMLLMFVTGIMNIAWMVVLTLLMVVEKTLSHSDGFRRITGFALIAWGAMIGIKFLMT